MFKGDSYEIDWTEVDVVLDCGESFRDPDEFREPEVTPAWYGISAARLGQDRPRASWKDELTFLLDEARWTDYWRETCPVQSEPDDLVRLDETLDPWFLGFDCEGDPEYDLG